MRFVKILNEGRNHLCEDCGISYKTMWLMIFHFNSRAIPMCISCIQKFPRAIKNKVKDVTWES